MGKQPPKILQKILAWFVSKELLEEISGDLEETYGEDHTNHGVIRANLNYLNEVLYSTRMYNRGRHFRSTNQLSMIQNYLKVAFRNIFKNKVYSFINISGLGIGLACVLVIFLFLKVETGYDKFHENGPNIYRLQHIYGMINAQAGPAFEREYADVVASMRINPWFRDRTVLVRDDEEYTEDVLVADDNFFTFFSFPIVEGDPKTCLSEKYSIALSESKAKKLFDSPAIGQTLQVADYDGDLLTLTVTAIFKDVPYHSHLQFDMVAPFELLKENSFMIGLLESWPNDWIGTYLQLDPKAIPDSVAARYKNIWWKYVSEQDTALIDFMPLENLHLESHHLNSDYAAHGNGDHVRIFTAIATIILLIASINFMNLATARAGKRSKEVGLRKAIGAYRKQLILQFISESALMTLFAFLLAAGILMVVIPQIIDFTGINLYHTFEEPGWLVMAGLSVFVITTLATSIYPALILSSFKPAVTLKPQVKTNGSHGIIRKILVVFQFATSVALIVAAIIIYDQMQFVKNKSLGFEAENLVEFNTGDTRQLNQKWSVVKGVLKNIPGVKGVAKTNHIPGDNAFYWNYLFEGADEIDDPHGEGWRGFYIGEQMVETLELEMLLGRPFRDNFPTDSATFLLNETGWKYAIETYGEEWKDPIGKNIKYFTSNTGEWALEKSGTVIGVVKDFHYHSLQMPIDPVVIHNIHGYRFVVKAENGSLPKVIKTVESNWTNWGIERKFNYKFVDEDFQAHYASEEQFNTFVLIFCLLAIAIACLGLFGLSLFTAQQRIKEIGVRKVLGASVPSVVRMLSMDFLKLVGIAILIAIPVVFYFLNDWLNNFSYRIDLSIWHFLIGAVIALVIAQFTISYHTILAALSNPSKSLRYE